MSTRFLTAPHRPLLVLLTAFIPAAYAFYPTGFFDPSSGQLTFVKWPLSIIDVNNDGDVSGPNDGIEYNFEVGNGGDGFTDTEASRVFDGLEEWERISTAYMAFRRGQDIADPVELTQGLDTIDAFNVVALLSEAEIADGAEDVTEGSLGITLTAFTTEDTFITVGNSTFPVNGGEFIDVDIVIAERARDLENEVGDGLFKSAGVILGGLSFGLGWSPLTNFDEDASEAEGVPIEERVVAIRNFDGTISTRGTTSSMFNGVYFYQDGGDLVLSGQDVALDDIAGITFLYPRSDLDLFFEIVQRARTQTRENFASRPLNGTWIRAWGDGDNRAGTSRVPMFDTLSGLYYDLTSPSFAGHFRLKGLFKQLETVNEQVFSASYTVTSSEFLPLVFGDDERIIYDTTHTTSAVGITFDTLFPSEVFDENGNLFGLENINNGTPLVFDLLTRKIVSRDSGKTLDVILAAGRPMFGDQDETCPLNVVIGPVEDGTAAIASLRTFRDNTLLGSPLGVATTDVFYRISPAVTGFLTGSALRLHLAQNVFQLVQWVVTNAEFLLAGVGFMLIAAVAKRQRLGRVMSVLFAIALFVSVSASAQMLPYEISDLLAMSDDVIVGTVTNVESRWVENNTRIVTNTEIEVSDAVKGTHNRNSKVHLHSPTGQVGAVVRRSLQLPSFEVGERVLVFLKSGPKGYTVVGGIAGKYRVVCDSKTSKEYVVPTSMPGHQRLEREIEKMRSGSVEMGSPATASRKPLPVNFEKRVYVALDEFKDYLREVDQAQVSTSINGEPIEIPAKALFPRLGQAPKS